MEIATSAPRAGIFYLDSLVESLYLGVHTNQIDPILYVIDNQINHCQLF